MFKKLQDQFSKDLLDAVSGVLKNSPEQIEEKKAVNKHGHDVPGEEDADVNNDGKVDTTDSYLKNRRKAIAKNMSMKKEEVEQIDEGEGIVTPKQKYFGEPPKGTFAYERKYGKYTAKGTLRKRPNPNKPPVQEEVETVTEAPVDGVAAGSMEGDKHLCATKVFHKEWAEGTPIFSQHAEPDFLGNIAWYDVMFEHGIERQVPTADMEILMAESHMMHKKKVKEETDYLEKDLKKRKANNDKAIKDMKKMGSPMRNPHFGEEVELDEARGRPKKAAAKDYTIHPVTKEKLMHNNPEHMKKIEALQRSGKLEKPKVEASQHIMNQLQKAKTSMQGGSVIHFTHGESQHVSGTHAAKLLDKYAGMKPADKEAFQKKISHSHEKLKSEL